MNRLAITALLVLLAGCATLDQQKGLAGSPDIRIADAAMASGIPQSALAVTRDILQSDPNNVPALLREAEALISLGQPNLAEEAYRRVLAVEPRSLDGLRGLGRISLANGDVKQAETQFRKVLEITPNDVAALNDLGIALDLQDRHDEAQGAYQSALAQRPDMRAARVNLGLSLAISGASDRALTILRPLADDPAADGKVREDLAVALTLAGDKMAADKVLQADMSSDNAAAALAGYTALSLPAK